MCVRMWCDLSLSLSLSLSCVVLFYFSFLVAGAYPLPRQQSSFSPPKGGGQVTVPLGKLFSLLCALGPPVPELLLWENPFSVTRVGHQVL